MGQALYRTYRSKNLAEVLGQEHITTALNHALKKGTISHAYLFTGPRGVGKTSTARILAFEINGLPYDENRTHLDIIEIDAASNRRIDEIRDLRDKVHIAPSSAKYKVYIIDEVHMLTKEAFNALLKTLEEPPAHVVFILATTEAHKLPETIISRTQRFAFKPAGQSKVIEHLRDIAKKEKIAITDDALALIAAHGEGSFRDSISLLDQVRNREGKVDLAEVQAVLGIAPEKLIHDITEALSKHDSIATASHLKVMHSQGYEPAQIAKQVGAAFRQAVIEGKTATGHEVSMKLLADLVQVPASPDPRAALEIALLDAALSGNTGNPASPAAHSAPSQNSSNSSSQKVMSEDVRTATPAIQIAPKRPEKERSEKAAPDKIAPEKTTETDKALAARQPATDLAEPLDADSDIILTNEAWELILNALKRKHNTLYSMINSAKPHFEAGGVTLEFSYAFHQKRINEAHNKTILAEIIQGVTGSSLKVICIVGQGKPRVIPTVPMPAAEGEISYSAAPVAAEQALADPGEQQVPAAQPAAADQTPQAIHQTVDSASLNTISDIFGGAEVLES